MSPPPPFEDPRDFPSDTVATIAEAEAAAAAAAAAAALRDIPLLVFGLLVSLSLTSLPCSDPSLSCSSLMELPPPDEPPRPPDDDDEDPPPPPLSLSDFID